MGGKLVKEKIENETPDKKFKRLASKRTQKVLDDLRILSNCSNRSNYQYEPEEVRKIFSSIGSEIERVKALFQDGERKRKEFRL